MSSTIQHHKAQIERLGKMIRNGVHNEPGNYWIARDYRRAFRALGLEPPRLSDHTSINAAMDKALARVKCSCGEPLIQTHSGTFVAHCSVCPKRHRFSRG